MNSKDICDILEASKGSNVKEIKLKDFTIKFSDLTNNVEYTDTSTNLVPFIGDIEVAEDSKDLERNTDTIVFADEFAAASLMASDPEAYEKALREG